MIKELTRENNRKEEELKAKEAYIRDRELALEKEVVRLTSEITLLKKNYELQLERISNSGSDTSKILSERYEREIQQLQQTIQQQQNDLKQTHSLQLQFGQLQLVAR